MPLSDYERKLRTQKRRKVFNMEEPGKRHSEVRRGLKRFNCLLGCDFVDTSNIQSFCNFQLFQSIYLKIATCLRDLGERVENNRRYHGYDSQVALNKERLANMATGNSKRKPYAPILIELLADIDTLVYKTSRYPVFETFIDEVIRPEDVVWTEIKSVKLHRITKEEAMELPDIFILNQDDKWYELYTEPKETSLVNEWVLPVDRIISCMQLLEKIHFNCGVSPDQLQELEELADSHLYNEDYDEYVTDFETLSKDIMFGGISHLPVHNNTLAKAILDLEHLTYIKYMKEFREILREYHVSICSNDNCKHPDQFKQAIPDEPEIDSG